MKRSLCLVFALLFSLSSVSAKGPRGRYGRHPRPIRNRFPVVVDYNGGAGWNGVGSRVPMPSGSASYVMLPPGWRGPLQSAVPPAIGSPVMVSPCPQPGGPWGGTWQAPPQYLPQSLPVYPPEQGVIYGQSGVEYSAPRAIPAVPAEPNQSGGSERSSDGASDSSIDGGLGGL